MPEAALTPERRRASQTLPPPAAPAPFVELGLVSCFSFLRGASDAVDLAVTARALGYDALGIADVNTMAGVVRLHGEARALGLRPVIGCRIETTEGLAFLAYPQDRQAYGRLCRLISAGRMATPAGEWQDKGACDITLAMLAAHSEGIQLVLVPPDDLDTEITIRVESNVVDFGSRKARKDHEEGIPIAAGEPDNFADERAGFAPDPAPSRPLRALRETDLTLALPDLLPHLTAQLPTLRHLAASYLYTGDDLARIARLDDLARTNGLALLATNLPLYHAPQRRPLHDVMTAIRHKTTMAAAGHLLEANSERHLKGPEEMARLFARWPQALQAARDLADLCTFSLEELRYEYPEETCPHGLDPQQHLDNLTWEGAARRYPSGVPDSVADTLRRELALIGKLDLARYFLTIKDIVDFARNQDPPILCQGRGSAANSAVCYCQEITAVDPARHALLFDRFISEE
ncbi:MAG: PHP domain-containing protein, partial [Novosphingobium sp.]